MPPALDARGRRPVRPSPLCTPLYCACFNNPCINILVPTSVMNITPRYWNFTCTVLLLTFSIHCLGFLERHNTSIFLATLRSRNPKNARSRGRKFYLILEVQLNHFYIGILTRACSSSISCESGAP